jgi:glycosyltransferase involved in cell wall biosynthesis
MKIAIVGPTHPYKGGIAQETTELAHRLTDEGHEVVLLSWKTQYPFFYPGQQFVPDNKPELPVHPGSRRVLSWKSPVGWARHIRTYRNCDRVMLVWWVPLIQGPVYLTMLRALGRKRHARISLLCHNVAAHEIGAGDKLARKLTANVMNRVDQVLVHTADQAVRAATITTTHIIVADLPPVTIGSIDPNMIVHNPNITHTLLFFGIVRKYKGLDVLLKAVALVPSMKLIVAGEFWQLEVYEKLLRELKIEDRVELRQGYVAAKDMAALFAEADASVLPYRGGTASFQVSIAHGFGVPVIATTASSFKTQVRDGIDGLLCAPDDVSALVKTIKRFYEPGVPGQLRSGVNPHAVDDSWQKYIEKLLGSV